MLRTAGEVESTAGHGGRRTGAERPRYMALDWEKRHVRVRLERPVHQAWVKLRESGGRGCRLWCRVQLQLHHDRIG